MGMPLYGAIPPTGYNWQAATWVSTGALVNRMNFALRLTADKLPGDRRSLGQIRQKAPPPPLSPRSNAWSLPSSPEASATPREPPSSISFNSRSRPPRPLSQRIHLKLALRLIAKTNC